MSNKDFSNRELDYERSISTESRGQIVVPLHHARNLKSVFGSSVNNDLHPVDKKQKVDDIVSVPVRASDHYNSPVVTRRVVKFERSDHHVAKTALDNSTDLKLEGSVMEVAVDEIESTKIDNKPMTVQDKENFIVTSKPVHQHVARRQEKLLKKQTAKEYRSVLKKAESEAKQDKKKVIHRPRIGYVVTPTKTGSSLAKQTGFTSQVLASAASTIPTNLDSSNLLIDNNGIAALPRENTGVEGLAKFNPRITFQIRIDRKKVVAFVKFILITGLLAISGYLAWDIWFTNKPIDYSFGQSAGAVSIDDTNPSNINPTTVSNQAWETHTAPANQPRYLYLSSLGIRSRVLSVGINSNGNIDAPKNANDTAWYDGSAKPGQDGQVFINGHNSYSSSFSAAFDNLDQVKVGDRITIETGNGDKFNYKVVQTESVETADVDMTKALNTPEGSKQGLTLMTYSGKYDYRKQTAEKRIIVYAVID